MGRPSNGGAVFLFRNFDIIGMTDNDRYDRCQNFEKGIHTAPQLLGLLDWYQFLNFKLNKYKVSKVKSNIQIK